MTISKKKRFPITLTIKTAVKNDFQKLCDKEGVSMSRRVENNMIKDIQSNKKL